MSDYKIIESLSHSNYNFYFKYKEEKNKKKSYYKSIVFTIILFIILLSSLTFYSIENKSIDLYTKYYKTYLTSINHRGIIKNSDTISTVFYKMNNGNFNEALSILNMIKTRNYIVDFYTAVSLQEIGNYQDAILNYNKVIKDSDNLFVEQSYWYSGLCYIKLSENEKAIENFKKIPENSFYKKQANEIISKIK